VPTHLQREVNEHQVVDLLHGLQFPPLSTRECWLKDAQRLLDRSLGLVGHLVLVGLRHDFGITAQSEADGERHGGELAALEQHTQTAQRIK